MAKIDVIRNTYGGTDYLHNALRYVRDRRAMYCGGYGVDPYDPDAAYSQMLATRRYFNKVSGNPLVHIVVAYDDRVRDITDAAIFGDRCARYFADRFQVLYCTHEKDVQCGHFHTHIVINSVSFINGQMIQTGYDDMSRFCQFVTQLTGQRSSFYFDNKADYGG